MLRYLSGVCRVATAFACLVPCVTSVAMAPLALMRSVWCPSEPTSCTSIYGPGGPGGVAVACGQEDRGDAYVRAAWFDLRSGRGRAEEVEAGASLGYGGDSCGYPVRVERGARRCAWALTWAGGRGRAQLCFVLGRALAAVLRDVLGFRFSCS